jgi:hypothetical protein
MSAAAHTAGPWRHDRRAILTPAGHCVAEVFSGGADSLEEADANGRLIAAAPELLHCAGMALEELQEYGRSNPLARVAIRALQAAIAAATGTTTTEQTGGAA